MIKTLKEEINVKRINILQCLFLYKHTAVSQGVCIYAHTDIYKYLDTESQKLKMYKHIILQF